MRKLTALCFMFFLALSFVPFTTPLQSSNPSEQVYSPAYGENWLTGWIYRVRIHLNGTTGASTNYPVWFKTEYSYGGNIGHIIYLFSHSQRDFDDVRFTDDDGSTELDYWRQEYTLSDDATFWVEVADDLSSDQIIYIYYGNSAVSTTSNGTATFRYFDNFNSDAYAHTGTTITISDGDLNWLSTSSYGDAELDISSLSLGTSGGWGIMGHFVWNVAPNTASFTVGIRDANGAAWGDVNDMISLRLYDDSRITRVVATVGGSGSNDAVWQPTTLVKDYWFTLWYNGTHGRGDLYSIEGFWQGGAAHGSIAGTVTNNLDVLCFMTRDIASSAGNMEWMCIRNFVEGDPADNPVYGAEEGEAPTTTTTTSISFIDWSEEWSFNAAFTIFGLILIPASTMYLAHGGRSDMSTDKLFYGLIAFFIGWAFVIGTVMP